VLEWLGRCSGVELAVTEGRSVQEKLNLSWQVLSLERGLSENLSESVTVQSLVWDFGDWPMYRDEKQMDWFMCIHFYYSWYEGFLHVRRPLTYNRFYFVFGGKRDRIHMTYHTNQSSWHFLTFTRVFLGQLDPARGINLGTMHFNICSVSRAPHLLLPPGFCFVLKG